MAGRIASVDFSTFLIFIIAIIVWLSLGSWGASILTRKNYLESDSPQVSRSSDVVRRMGPLSVSPQMILAVAGPVVLIIALVLPKRS
jgi:hypothetical protein